MSKSLSKSQFNMWRSIVSLVMSDGKRHPDEEAFLSETFAKLSLSSEQRQQLDADLETPTPVDSHFAKITEPRDRSQFVYFARLLFWSDGDFSQQEKSVHEKLTEKVLGQTNLQETMRDLDKVVDDFIADDERRRSSLSIGQRLVDALVFWEKLF